jgi:hypothetical protein
MPEQVAVEHHLLDETLCTFSEAAQWLPRIGGKRLSTATLWRWARKGIKGLHLETRRIGIRFLTSREALDRFTKALSELPPGNDNTPAPRPAPSHRGRSETQRKADIIRANKELADDGL